ncbi:MAG: tetratricopeptide repeat protein [Terriglobales bacterium]|jgi:tetratricopeptide (TPR) repeat protein
MERHRPSDDRNTRFHKGRVRFATACCVIFLVAGASAQGLGDRVDAIDTALHNREYETALELLRPALRLEPRNEQLWAMQGKAYAGEGQNKEALASFANALRTAPDYIPALQGEAQIDFDAGSAEAIPILQHLLRLRRDDRTSHGMLAVLEYRQGNCAAAAPQFEKAGALFDAQVDALHAYAICLVRLKQIGRAAEVFERALTLEPQNSQERKLVASVQLMARQPKAAIGTLEPMLGSNQTDVETLELASAAYEASNQTDQAVDLLKQAITLDPSNVRLYLHFADISSVHQSFQVGINVVNDGISQRPKAAPLYFARGVLYVQTGQFDQAQADFEKAYELDPRQSLSAAAQGLAAVEANDLDKALTTVQRKLQARPNDPTLLYLEADVLVKKEAEPGTPEFQLAMRSARKAIALRPTLGPAHAVLAKLYLQAAQYPEAIEQCKKALEIDPKDQTSMYRLIQALRKTGNTNDVPALLKRLASIRQQATKEEMEHYRYKLVEGSTEEQPAQP